MKSKKTDVKTPYISALAAGISPSATLTLSAAAKKMKMNGIDVVDFSAGEPDFFPPENVKEAAKDAVNTNKSRYTPTEGIQGLREAIVEKFRRDNDISCKVDEVMASNGAKHALMNAFYALLNIGDEVIIPIPYWVSYVEQVRLAHGKPIFCYTDKFKAKACLIKSKITPRTKVIVINSPNNPSGAVADEKDIRQIADLAVKNNIYVISDEVYEPFVYNGRHISIASLNERIRQLTITINSASKTYSIPGWRLGYCSAPADIIAAMAAIQSHQTSNPCNLAQYAAVEALNGKQDFAAKMKKEFKKRRDYMVEELNKMEGISCTVPEGAFYAFPNISKTRLGSEEFARQLLKEANVAVVPGAAFGDDSHVRISYAASMKDIEKGMQRMKGFCRKL